MIDYTPKHLVMVEAGQNRNKYYDMQPNGDMWVAKYGRVGSSSQTRTYYKSQFEKKYNEKIRKGYVDQTDLVQDLISVEKPKVKPEYRPINNPVINEIVERLQSMARKVISENYTVSSNKVTQAMVDEAQDIITGLLNITDVKQFNDELVRLFTTIPRKMSYVKGYIADNPDDFNKIIHREQDLLDVMKGQVVQKQIVDKAEEDDEPINNITVLEALGLEFDECSKDDIATIKVALGSCADKFHKAWKVKNIKTQARFDKFVEDNNIKDVRLLFHGSRNENWWSIIQSGLVLRPTNAIITGKMFGIGSYFSPTARKSLGYTSLTGSYWAKGNSVSGFMALMSVAYGKPYDVYSFNSDFYSLDYDRLQKKCAGANCLHAHAGSMLRNDEIVIYKEEQSTIKYLVEIKNG
jgi:poly [ADP-ribose] polymerase